MMLTLTALTLLAKGAIVYFSNSKTTESKEKIVKDEDVLAENLFQNKEDKPCTLNAEVCSYSNRNIRRDVLFNQIAKILVEPSEESIYPLEELINQISLFYPYDDRIKKIYQNHSPTNVDIEDFVLNIILDDFYNFLSENILWENQKDSLHKLMSKLSPIVKISLRGNSRLDVMASFFKDNNKSVDYVQEFLSKVKGCYKNIFGDPNSNMSDGVKSNSFSNIRNYNSLLGMAGRTYRNLINLYESEGIFDGSECLSNEMVYDIASSILQNTNFYFCRGLSTSRLAKDIMDSIIDFLHNDLMQREVGMVDEEFVNSLFNRYIGNREIHSYYYFLKMMVKICQSLSKENSQHNEGEIVFCINDEIKEYIIKNITKCDFQFLRNIDAKEVYNDVTKAYNDNDWKLIPE